MKEFPREKGYGIRNQVKLGTAPAPSTAMACAITLIVLFFVVQVAIYVLELVFPDKAGEDSSSKKKRSKAEMLIREFQAKLKESLRRARLVVQTAPMILLLMMVVRLRGVVDLEMTQPDNFTRRWGFVCATASFCIDAAIAFIPRVPGGPFGTFFLIATVLTKLFLNIAVVVMIVSLFTMEKSG